MKRKLLMLSAWLCIFLSPLLLSAQNKTISAQVTEANGSPIAGATITAKNGAQTIAADAQGNFTLSLSPGALITISATGFKTKTIKVADLTGAAIILEEDVARLDEVVVTGLSTTVKRRNLANAVTTISSKQLSGTAPAQTLDAELNGKIPGAYINANSGAPGGGISIKLRGVTSVFGNTQPLYVVDGVYMDNSSTSAGLNAVTAAAAGGNVSNQDNASSRIADLRQEDIENIEILKGASAAAIYGARAAAGVVIITTKRGRSGKTNISLSQDVGFIKVRKLLGVRQFTAETAADLGGGASDTAAAVIAKRKALSQQFSDAQSAGKIYNYEDEVYNHTGFARNTVMSITGGSEKTSFYVSGAQKKEEGIVIGTGYRNTSLRLNIDHKITDNIKLGISANYINSSADRGLTGNDNAGVTYSIALSSTPGFAELHPDQFGNYPNNPFGSSNVLQTIALMKNNENTNRFTSGISLDAILQKSDHSVTRFVGRGGVDFYNLYTNALFPRELQFQSVNHGTSVQGATKSFNANYILSLVNTFNRGDNFGLTSSAGYTQETGDYNNLLDVATQLAPNQSNVDQGGSLTAQQLRNKFQNNGIFVQEEALIKDAITLTGGLRFDNSTYNGGKTGKFNAYPKAGASINLTRLGIFNDKTVQNLKLRGAYGQSANFPAIGSKFTTLVASNLLGIQGSIVNVQAGDPNIKPEKQTELEGGIDFSVLNSRLNFELTVYSKKIFDFLLLATVQPSSGFSTKWVNAGDLRNRGIELGMNAKPVDSKTVTWNTTVNFWFNRSKVTKLTIPPVVLGSFGTSLGSFRIEEGKSATQIVGTDAPGKEGLVDLGNSEPKFQMNTFNEITFFKKLSLRFLIHWKYKGDNVNLTNLLNDFGSTSADYDADADGNGVPDGPQRIGQFLGGSARGFVQDAGYLRFREIGLYYTFASPLKAIRDIRVGASLNNYFTITHYKGYDPEVSNFGTGFSTGVDVDPFPASKRAQLNVAINF